ncbi:carbohydrate ABC transporter permease [Demetria terragena]|uniref:carbohydrate ABC transporter permease n=1 Tax=Demetria terragena TaxID=63959 RepID=UPI000382E736|nr:carbohydrate ABC transporter permease [Demetria terragena]
MSHVDQSAPPTVTPTKRRVPATRERSNWKVTLLLVACSLTVLLPLYLAVSMSLKTDAEARTGSGFSLPGSLNFDNFARAWELTDIPRAATISILIAVVSVVGALVVCSMAAYAIVRNWDRKVFRYSYFYLLAAMFIPFPVVALPQVKLTAVLGLDGPVGVGLLHVLFGMSFNILLYTAFLRSVPYELEESARIDGCSTWQTFWRLIFPLLAPMNATVGIFAFLASWNDYMMPAIITADPSMQSLPVVQQLFQNELSINYNVAFASYLMAMAPTLIVYLFAQRWVMSGVTQGAIK